MSNEETFTIFSHADADYCLAIRGGKLVLSLYDTSNPYQQWMKKDSGTTDREGQPAFALVNKANNEAVKHEGTTGPMTLVPYIAGSRDNSLLWSKSKNDDNGFRYIRRASVISHHITANAHVIQDGRIVDLSDGSHISERWKFVPYNDQQVETLNTVTISCRRKDGYNLTIRDDTLVLAPADNKDRYQIWIREPSYGYQVKDQENNRSFALINKATGKAIKHGFGTGYLAKLGPFNRNNLDESFLWTMSDKGQGFREIRMQSNTSAVFHAFYVHEPDSSKALLALRPRNNSSDQQWKFQETTVWDPAWDTSTTPPASKPSGVGQWDPKNADIYFDSSK